MVTEMYRSMYLSFSHGFMSVMVFDISDIALVFRTLFMTFGMIFYAHQTFFAAGQLSHNNNNGFFCKQRGMETCFGPFLHYFVTVIYSKLIHIIYNTLHFLK